MTTDHAHGTTPEAELDNKTMPTVQELNHAPDTNPQRGPMQPQEEEFVLDTRAECIVAAAEAHAIHTTYITIWGFRNGISEEQCAF